MQPNAPAWLNRALQLNVAALAVLGAIFVGSRQETATVPALAAIAAVAAFLVTDRRKAWDAVYDATKAANSADGFTGEDGLLRVSLITKGSSSIRTSSTRDFDIAPIFSDLANDDYERAIGLARGFEREAPRASATIAIARAVLEEKKK